MASRILPLAVRRATSVAFTRDGRRVATGANVGLETAPIVRQGWYVRLNAYNPIFPSTYGIDDMVLTVMDGDFIYATNFAKSATLLVVPRDLNRVPRKVPPRDIDRAGRIGKGSLRFLPPALRRKLEMQMRNRSRRR